MDGERLRRPPPPRGTEVIAACSDQLQEVVFCQKRRNGFAVKVGFVHVGWGEVPYSTSLLGGAVCFCRVTINTFVCVWWCCLIDIRDSGSWKCFAIVLVIIIIIRKKNTHKPVVQFLRTASLNSGICCETSWGFFSHGSVQADNPSAGKPGH